MKDIFSNVVLLIVNFIVTSSLGYVVAILKNNKKKEKVQEEALKCLLRSNLVNQYFVYKQAGKMPYYVKQSWYLMYEAYIKLGGNSFVKDLKIKIDKFDVCDDVDN